MTSTLPKERTMTEGDVFMLLWLIGGLALPFFPITALIYLVVLILMLFIPASWLGLDEP